MSSLKDSASKKYAVVGFEDGKVEVIPTIWMSNNRAAKWPTRLNQNAIVKSIKECREPEEDWPTLNIRTYCFAISHLLKSSEEIKEELKLLNRKVRETHLELQKLKGESGDNDMPRRSVLQKLPDHIKLPLDDDAQLISLNDELGKNDQLQCQLLNYLAAGSIGKTPSKLLHKIVRNLMTRDVAILYSRLGRKGKKSFEDLKSIFNVIIACASIGFKDLRREELADHLGRVLAGATDWDGLRSKKNPPLPDLGSDFTLESLE